MSGAGGMMRRRLFVGSIAVIALLLVLAATSPSHVAYWVGLAIAIGWAVPEFAPSLPALVVRHVVLFSAVVVGIPLAISSPHHRTFWVLLGALLFILLPLFGVVSWFYAEIRRLQRERKTE